MRAGNWQLAIVGRGDALLEGDSAFSESRARIAIAEGI